MITGFVLGWIAGILTAVVAFVSLVGYLLYKVLNDA